MPGGAVVTEADTCRKFVVPRLQTAGGKARPRHQRRTFTDGRVIFVGGKAKRGRQKRADYILRYRADYGSIGCEEIIIVVRVRERRLGEIE